MSTAVTPFQPYHRCPKCPKCGGPGVTVPYAPRPECYSAPTNLVCCACGDGWIGTPKEVAQARRADAAYDKALAEGRL